VPISYEEIFGGPKSCPSESGGWGGRRSRGVGPHGTPDGGGASASAVPAVPHGQALVRAREGSGTGLFHPSDEVVVHPARRRRLSA
jgi:hypothetical protein